MKLSDWFRPSSRAGALFLIAARGGRRGSIARSALITLHSCDVAPGAQIDAPPVLPHPASARAVAVTASAPIAILPRGCRRCVVKGTFISFDEGARALRIAISWILSKRLRETFV